MSLSCVVHAPRSTGPRPLGGARSGELQIVGVLDDRLNLALGHLPPDRRIVETREVAANREPQGLRIGPGDAKRREPVRDRRIGQAMQRARRKRLELGLVNRAEPWESSKGR